MSINYTGVRPVLAEYHSCQYIVKSFYQHIKLYAKNDVTMYRREMVFGKNWSHTSKYVTS